MVLNGAGQFSNTLVTVLAFDTAVVTGFGTLLAEMADPIHGRRPPGEFCVRAGPLGLGSAPSSSLSLDYLALLFDVVTL